MKPIRILQVLAPVALSAFFATSIAPIEAKPAAKNKAKIAWQPTMESAQALSKRTGKPLMVDFYATWCGPCKLLDTRVYTNAMVITESRNWINVKVDGEKRPDLMKKYNLSGFPSILFIKSNGKVLKQQSGLSVPPAQSKSIDKAVAYISRDMTRTMKTLRAQAKGATRSA